MKDRTRSVVFALVITAAVLAVYGTLAWLGMPAGQLVDWIVGIAGFWWLLGVVTIPWNIYFGARRVKTELIDSALREIEVRSTDIGYVDQAARRSLAVAIALHGVSALGFGALAWFGLTPVGWFAAGAATGLTLFRPAVRLYHHVVATLGDISRRVRYPRDDIRTVLTRLDEHELQLGRLLHALDESEETSWAHRIVRASEEVERRLERIRADHVALEQQNRDAHEQLSREAQRAAERVAEDGQFLGNVREIIRFVKEA